MRSFTGTDSGVLKLIIYEVDCCVVLCDFLFG